jgi:diketogulonate reductase-like aldo/keto reductase
VTTRRAWLGLSTAFALGAVTPATIANPALIRKPVRGLKEGLPVIGLGTYQTFDTTEPAAMANLRDVLGEFASLGGRLIDSSPMYGHAEQVAGELMQRAKLTSNLFVATKVWTRGKDSGIAQMEASMKKLRVETIDLMQVHNLVDLDTHLATLTELKNAGRVRFVGITHYAESAYADVARAIDKHALDFLQINYSVAERAAEKRLLPLAAERHIAVIANRPFAGGQLLRRRRGTPLPAWAAECDASSWAQLLLKFVVAHPAITCAIPATSKLDHLRDNMKAGVGQLPDDTLRNNMASLV